MKLTALKPKWFGMPYFDVDGCERWPSARNTKQAFGIRFLCPVCFKANGGPVGTHAIMCWDDRVPQDFAPAPGRWNRLGRGFATLTLVGGRRGGKKRSNSVLLTSKGGCRAHFHVRDGMIR